MKNHFYTLLSAAALGAFAALPASAQEAPAQQAEQAKPPINPTILFQPPAEYLNNPEWMLNLDLSTGGRVVIQLRPDLAPNHVERVKTLARQGFYDGVIFHRVIDEFMAQTGDPTGTGTGGSTLPDLAAELNRYPHMRGTVSMARAASYDSANSQFFITFMPRLTLDKNYTVFGRVTQGMEHVDAINRGEPPADPSRILQASVAADNKPVPVAPPVVRQPVAPAETRQPRPVRIAPQPETAADQAGSPNG